MHVYVIFAHPSHKSFTCDVLDQFIAGLRDAGHTFELSDLYAMGFQTDMDLEQYNRETGPDPGVPVPSDVAAEHTKITAADALVFIYPVWWSDCPAKLKGWFDRVWSYGYAYIYEKEGAHATSNIDVAKALVICPAGNTRKQLEDTGIAESMRRVMIDDRLLSVGIKEARMEILD
ncbi:MAG: NAD(P)H-dependent oxidoreductase, partial [bacterium]